MAIPKPANRPRFIIGRRQRAAILDRIKRRLFPMRPKRGPIIMTAASASSGTVQVRQAVRIIGGEQAGEAGIVTFIGAGVAYVQTTAGVVKVRADMLVAAKGPEPAGPAGSQP